MLQPAPYQPLRNFSLAEYLSFDDVAVTKSEYLRGDLLVMPGVSREHSLLQTSLFAQLDGVFSDAAWKYTAASFGCMYPSTIFWLTRMRWWYAVNPSGSRSDRC